MGLTRLFTIDADLTKMLKSQERVFVNKMLQKARIEVSEEGTQAAAVTGGGIAPSSAPNTFLANRPFLYIIYETSTNAIFFMGEYTGVE
jgi:serine protease inhibitor